MEDVLLHTLNNRQQKIPLGEGAPLQVTLTTGDNEYTQEGFVQFIDANDSSVDVWSMASDGFAHQLATKTFPATAAAIYAASTAAGDTSLDFITHVIDATGKQREITFTTNASDGRTPVALGINGLDCNFVRLVGDDQAHTGNIFITQGNAFTAGVPDDLTTVLAHVKAGYGRSHQSHLTTQSEYNTRLRRIVITIARASGASGSIEVHLEIKRAGESWVVDREWHLVTGVFEKSLTGLLLPSGSRVRVRLEDVSDSDTNVTAEIVYELEAT